MKVVSRLKYNPSAVKYERGGGPQIAIPDQSLSVREILERFRRGTIDPEEVMRKNFFDEEGEEDLEVFDAPIQDLTDLSDVIHSAKQRMDKEQKSVPADQMVTNDNGQSLD